MIRSSVAAIVGYLVWTVLWVGGYGVLLPGVVERFERGESILEPEPLGISLGFAASCSLVAGVVCGFVDRTNTRRAAAILGVLLLATGVAVQASVWDRMALWYQLTFLAHLVPVTLIGARLTSRRAAPDVTRSRGSS
ncbi:MAG: hypothetical protein R3F34_04365 [Planctomycetota bacterium]